MNEILQGVATTPGYLIACGIIWAITVGFAIGNYACSLVFRLPRNLSILADKPYCGTCRTPLQVIDLFPVFSALWLRHRCRYCGTPYPTSHTWTEILVGVLLVVCFLAFSYSERFCLVAALGVFLIIQACIEANDKVILRNVLLSIAVLGMLTRTLMDVTIFDFFAGGFLGMLIGMGIWRKQLHRVKHIYNFPEKAQLIAVAGICVGSERLPFFLLLLGVFWLISRLRKGTAFTIPYGFAVIIPVLYPELGIFPLIRTITGFSS